MSNRRFPRQASAHSCQSGSRTVRISQRMPGVRLQSHLAQLPVDGLTDTPGPVPVWIDQLSLVQCIDLCLQFTTPLFHLSAAASGIKLRLVQPELPFLQ